MASYDIGKEYVIKWVKRKFPPGSTCLDVGACDGKWAKLFNGYFRMDGVEIYQPNIWNHNLLGKYRFLANTDIGILLYDYYDLIIFGDVLEHMPVEKAQKVLEYAYPRCKDMIVAVPYNLPQKAIYDNPWEVHIQPDLDDEKMAERYPMLEMIYKYNEEYAYFHKKENR
ncbi:MAG: hypothetical protein J6V08_04645 [Candidatus Methanomethylophilaceae archaeon]|nr:hypothetical protein [Candidatus Methanomethylophilaceae archaeon]